jgi:hypothetical protein
MPLTGLPLVLAPAYDAIVAWGIGGLAVCMAAVVWTVISRSHAARAATAGMVIVVWMTVTGLVAATGQLARFDRVPPPMALLIVAVFALAFGAGLGPIGGRLATAVPLATLVLLQAFRLPLELVMHRAATLGIMPPEMSYSGYNLDLVTGAGALVLGWLLRAGVAVPRAAVWIWNVWGLWCLAVITVVAVASAPMVRAFGDDPRHVNTWVLFFPYVWLPAVLVTVALAGHLVVMRALLTIRRSAA